MSTTILIISDLHLADGHAILDGFGEPHLSAFEGFLLAASPRGPLGQADNVELIINGDCFDFLATPPYQTGGGHTSEQQALTKLEAIIAAHAPFFELLRNFCALPGRRLTFTTGNHDIELCFARVRQRLSAVLGVQPEEGAVYFCPTRGYRPLPDVYVEHGNHYDFWNHRVQGLWDAQGQPLTREPETLLLPVGSLYFQEAGIAISEEYPYFDHLEPSMSYTRMTALLSLLKPAFARRVSTQLASLIGEQHSPMGGLSQEELARLTPAKFFEQAMLEILAFQQTMQEREVDWTPPVGWDAESSGLETIMEYNTLRETLDGTPLAEAVSAICTPTAAQTDDETAVGMRAVLNADSSLRYAIAGHTHTARIDPRGGAQQVYLNTGTWTTRLAMPTPGEITPELIAWLRQPEWQQQALRDVTQRTFALINASEDGPSSASLCVWEGGLKGRYRVLA